MAPLPGAHSMYWFPKSSTLNRPFYLYYSVGDKTLCKSGSLSSPSCRAFSRIATAP